MLPTTQAAATRCTGHHSFTTTSCHCSSTISRHCSSSSTSSWPRGMAAQCCCTPACITAFNAALLSAPSQQQLCASWQCQARSHLVTALTTAVVVVAVVHTCCKHPRYSSCMHQLPAMPLLFSSSCCQVCPQHWPQHNHQQLHGWWCPVALVLALVLGHLTLCWRVRVLLLHSWPQLYQHLQQGLCCLAAAV